MHTTTKEIIERWFERGLDRKSDFMIVACDTFDYEDYPIYTSTENFCETINGIKDSIMEVYDLSMTMGLQLSEHRAFHCPLEYYEQKNRE